jgi:hypothetical membrane protein
MPNLLKVGAAAGLAAPILGFACILSAVASYAQFSWTQNALSDLGVVSGITGNLFNFGLVAAGALAFVFAVLGLFGFAGKRWVGNLGSSVFAVASISLICIGIFNENYSPTHYLVSVAFFTLAPIALLILTCTFFLNRQRGTAAFTLAIGVAAALPWILEFTVKYVSGVAIPETLSGLAVSAWVIAVATKMLKSTLSASNV